MLSSCTTIWTSENTWRSQSIVAWQGCYCCCFYWLCRAVCSDVNTTVCEPLLVLMRCQSSLASSDIRARLATEYNSMHADCNIVLQCGGYTRISGACCLRLELHYASGCNNVRAFCVQFSRSHSFALSFPHSFKHLLVPRSTRVKRRAHETCIESNAEMERILANN